MLQRLDFVERRHAVPRLVRWLSMVALTLLGAVALAAPTDVILVLDNSGSMRNNDPEFLLKRAVTAFVNELGDDTHIGMVIFDQKVVYPVALGPLDVASRDKVRQSLESIDYRGKFTDIPAAIERAIYELKTSARAEAVRVIVFMTDGIVDTGNAAIDAEKAKWLRDELVGDAADNAIRIFGIAFTDAADFFLIQSLANKTGGEYFRAPRAADLAGVFGTVQERLAAAPAVAPAPAAPPAVAAPDTAPIAAPAVPATCLDTLSAEERLAMEETAPSAGITAEEMCRQMEQAAPGTVIVHAPPSATDAPVTADSGGGALNVVIIGVLALILVLMVVVVVLVLRRRGGVPAAPVTPATSPVRVPEAYLKDIHGITQQGPVRLTARPLFVGRVAGGDPEHLDYFVVDKGTVGRRHALIQFRDYSFWLSDQGSVNGTFLNGERITGDRQLKHGDRIKFHKYEFEFSMPELDDANHTVFATSHDMTIVGDATLVGAPVVAAVAAAAAAERPPAANRADAEVFDVTGEGDDVDGDKGAGQVDLFVDGDDTALSARGAAASTDFLSGEGADDMPAFDPRDDHGDLAGFANSSATGSGDAFDTEASAFFDDDLGSSTAYEDAAAQFGGSTQPPTSSELDDSDDFVTALPDAPAADSRIFSESETLLPEAAYADDATSETASNISLDRFMETEAFFNRGAGEDREDATLMPEQVPDEQPAPAMDDFFDITGVDINAEADPDDDDSESPTKFRR